MDEPALRKWDYIYYALIVGTVLSFGLALLGFVGERLGWWNDLGEIFMYVGTATGVVLGATTIVVGSSRTQVEAARRTVESTRTAVEHTKNAVEDTKNAVEETTTAVDETKAAVEETKTAVEANGQTLASVDEGMTRQTRVLEEIRDRI